MDERETLILKVTDKATKEAKKQNMNEAQTKLFVDTEVQKAVSEYDKKLAEKVNQNSENSKQTVENNKKENKKYIVYTPVRNYCGEVAGVQFAYGKAEVKPGWILNWFKEHGYKVEEVSE